jgi:hypothetical protein
MALYTLFGAGPSFVFLAAPSTVEKDAPWTPWTYKVRPQIAEESLVSEDVEQADCFLRQEEHDLLEEIWSIVCFGGVLTKT